MYNIYDDCNDGMCIRPLQASVTRIKHSMEDGPCFSPVPEKVLLYSYRVDVTYL